MGGSAYATPSGSSKDRAMVAPISGLFRFFNMGLVIGYFPCRSCVPQGIGSLGQQLSRSKDLSSVGLSDRYPRQVAFDAESGGAAPVKMIFSRCPIHRGCTNQVFFGEKAHGRMPNPHPGLNRDAERDFPCLVPESGQAPREEGDSGWESPFLMHRPHELASGLSRRRRHATFFGRRREGTFALAPGHPRQRPASRSIRD